MPSLETREQYCGDGVYASWNGYELKLDLRAQVEMNSNPNCEIVLDPQVFTKVLEFRNACVRQDKALREAESNVLREDS